MVNSKYTIYKLLCLKTGKTYIGSTKNKIGRRISGHRANYRQFVKGNKKYNYCSSFDVLKNNDYECKVLLEICGDDINQAYIRKLERKYVEDELRKGICLNRNIPSRSQDEYRRIHRQKLTAYHRRKYNECSKFREYKRKYYLRKKEKMVKIYCKCCKKEYYENSKTRHFQTKYHIKRATSKNKKVEKV